MAQTPDGTPYVEGSDFVSGWPSVSRALADQIDALRRMQPVGMITPYAGELKSADDLAAIDGWLPCDGKAYKRADFPDLYTRMSVWQAHTGFPPDTPNGTPNTANFYVPDFRGRSPVGPTGSLRLAAGDPVFYRIDIGQRPGDQRIPSHRHNLPMDGTGAWPSIGYGSSPGDLESQQAVSGLVSSWPSGTTSEINGVGFNMSPLTGVNFIVWTGTTTVGKSPISGVEVSPMTTRMMLEARLEETDLGEEQIEMLRIQLAALKDGEE